MRSMEFAQLSARHTREHLWPLTDVIVLGGNEFNLGTFWRVPTDLKSWTSDQGEPIGHADNLDSQ